MAAWSGGPVLVTGGCGWLGSNVVAALLAAGAEVVALDLPELVEASPASAARLVAADISQPGEAAAAVAASRPAAIVHLAYLLGPASQAEVERAITVNCLGTARVFEAALAAAVERVVWLSSSAVYGPPEPYGEDQIDEDDLRGAPRLFYGSTKRFDEEMAALYTRERGLDQIALRLALGYGPPGRDRGFSAEVSNLFEGAFSGRPTSLVFPDAPQSWVYVDDVVAAILLALQAAELEHRVFNVSSDTIYTPIEVGELLRGRFPAARLEFRTEGRAEWPARLDYSRARRELGYVPMVDIEEGISRYAAHWEAHGR
ncbi:MAG TPA: NAD(P)-dependent oxidoreductase [Solirubrobacterales bacterium]|jgi:nucleoside-diphosphate-sugar epimerase|nr:NAD(P)-dependent oxidoreductase [Solirubrobacterales bacterium]